MKAKYITIFAVITAMTFGFVWVRLKIIRISYDIHKYEMQEKQLRQEVNGLALRIDKAKSPQHLEHMATGKFQMHAPAAAQTILITN